MLLFKRKSLTEEKDKVSENILNWGIGNERFLNVVSLPYNSPEIFLEIILYYVKNEKSVVYITNEYPDNINILELIKRRTNFRDYSYVRTSKANVNSRLKVCDFANAIKLKEKFDLVIYDDIRSFPTYSKYEVLDLVSKMCNENTKIIYYSIEGLFRNEREILIPVKDAKIPIIEPRTILTRIDISKDIPFVIYDYLKWSINSNRKVIICVPDEEKVESVYLYMKNYCKNISKNIVPFIKGKSDKKLISNFTKIKRMVIVTNEFEEVLSKVENADVMVYFADDFEFNYKKLIYFCASVGRGEKEWKGEVIFLANEETRDMEKAKDITRNFNKEAWEMGLLKI